MRERKAPEKREQRPRARGEAPEGGLSLSKPSRGWAHPLPLLLPTIGTEFPIGLNPSSLAGISARSFAATACISRQERASTGIGFLAVLTATVASQFVKTERGAEHTEILDALHEMKRELSELRARLDASS